MTLKTLIPLLALGVVCRGVAVETPSATVADFLYAVRQVESGGRYDGPPGPKGELGAYQFRRQVWYQHTQEPFEQARTAYADQVAQRHYGWISDRLRSAGVARTTWNLAAAWNSGITAVRAGRIPHSTRDYANRVENIVSDEIETRRALTPHFRIVADAR